MGDAVGEGVILGVTDDDGVGAAQLLVGTKIAMSVGCIGVLVITVEELEELKRRIFPLP